MVVDDILASGSDPLMSRHLPRLWALAERDGPKVLASFRRQLDAERIADLALDLMANRTTEIIAADNPHGFFLVALVRLAISWVRRPGAAVYPDPPADVDRTSAGDRESSEEARAFVLDAREALAALSERDRAIALGVGAGENREALARLHGTSRANVDQIVSRLRREWNEAQR